MRYPAEILATCVAPWDERGEFIEQLFVDQVKRLLGLTKRLYIFGTAGEGYAVTDRQFQRSTRVFLDTMRAGGAEPMVGVISLSLPVIVERIEWARRIGVRQFQISLPGWGALTDDEVRAFFREVCGRFADCEFLHYNLLRTKRLIAPDFYAELAEAHPNLVATKNSTDSIDRIAGLMREVPRLCHFFNETGFVHGSLLGECGLLASVATTNAAGCRAYFEAGRRRDMPTLLAMHAEIEGVTAALLASAGPGPHMDGAFDKVLWKLQDSRFPLRLLPPYQGADDSAFMRFAETVRARFPRWLPD